MLLGHEPIETSYWSRNAPRLSPLPALQKVITADTVVIGAGYTGLSAALHAAESGRKVVVLEAKEPGWAASGRNAGQVCPFWGGPDAPTPEDIVTRFGKDLGSRMNVAAAGSGRFVFDLIDRLGIDCAPRRGGHLQVVRSEKSLRKSLAIAEQYRTFGAPVDFVDGPHVRDFIASDRYEGGLLYRDGGAIQPLSYARGLAKAAIAAGATIYAHSPALAIEPQGNCWRVRTPNGTVDAENVLFGTGAYSDNLSTPLLSVGYKVTMAIVVSEPLPDLGRALFPGGLPVVDTDDSAVFSPSVDPTGRLTITVLVGPRAGSTEALARIANARLRKVFPQMKLPRWESHWFGQLVLTPDHLPRIIHLAPGIYAGIGCNGFGITLATLMGHQMSRLAAGTPDALVDLPVTAPTKAPLARFMPKAMRYLIFPMLNRLGA
ncbi:NAD(P)/FAD-dependent oxidoreductase [Paraburkholderia megapolitana]|uniref:NAD(P)/FAD-dependent oxidoreductase n=1 Tax=Paraburkholderia megapolitana TaxID=420953 RepID=UPI0038B7A40C